MKKLLAIEIGLTILQIILFGFSFPLVLSIIGRLLFFIKMLGTGIKLGWTIGFEISAIFFLVLIPIFLNSQPKLWEFLGYSVIAIISILIMWYDEEFYVYSEEDV